ncbi:MAG: hypothetical protein JXR83_16200, partial [Deltaproteobacteria bacterium]|nr:hypothetical protein [Deltaproteobacteria bacterium]
MSQLPDQATPEPPRSAALGVIHEPELARAVQCVFVSAGMDLEFVPTGAKLAELGEVAPRTILLYEVEGLEQWEHEYRELQAVIDRSPGIRVIYLMMGPDREQIYRILSRPYSANILSTYDTDDLFVSLRKAARQDIFGIE